MCIPTSGLDFLFVVHDAGESQGLKPVAERLVENRYSVGVLALGPTAQDIFLRDGSTIRRINISSARDLESQSQESQENGPKLETDSKESGEYLLFLREDFKQDKSPDDNSPTNHGIRLTQLPRDWELSENRLENLKNFFCIRCPVRVLVVGPMMKVFAQIGKAIKDGNLELDERRREETTDLATDLANNRLFRTRVIVFYDPPCLQSRDGYFPTYFMPGNEPSQRQPYLDAVFVTTELVAMHLKNFFHPTIKFPAVGSTALENYIQETAEFRESEFSAPNRLRQALFGGQRRRLRQVRQEQKRHDDDSSTQMGRDDDDDSGSRSRTVVHGETHGENVVGITYVGGYAKNSADFRYATSLRLLAEGIQLIQKKQREAGSKNKIEFAFAFAPHPGQQKGYDRHVLRETLSESLEDDIVFTDDVDPHLWLELDADGEGEERVSLMEKRVSLMHANAVSDITVSQESTNATLSCAVGIPHIFLGTNTDEKCIHLPEKAGIVKRFFDSESFAEEVWSIGEGILAERLANAKLKAEKQGERQDMSNPQDAGNGERREMEEKTDVDVEDSRENQNIKQKEFGLDLGVVRNKKKDVAMEFAEKIGFPLDCDSTGTVFRSLCENLDVCVREPCLVETDK